MAISLLNEIKVFDRDELKAQYLRSYGLRAPLADVGPGTQVDVDASSMADMLMVLHQDARLIGDSTNLDTSRGARLEQWGEVDGIPRPQASPSSGYVDITTATGGTTILDGDELREPQSGQRFRCTVEALYTATNPPPISSVDTGPATNLPAGTVLQWTNPRAGCAKNCVVRADSDGNGLAGGRNEATDEEWIAILKDARRNPPSGGNDGAYRKAVLATPGLQVEGVFTYPAIFGPGTTAIAFTLKPSELGGNRAPNLAQRNLVEASLIAQFPGDDGFFVVEVVSEDVEIAVEIEWRGGVSSWADVIPWPEYVATDEVRVIAGVTPTATTFRVGTTGTSTTTPQVGQTIGFWDAANAVFKDKRISSIVVVTPDVSWTITVDTSLGASDETFVPAIGDLVSPWSDSLDAMAAPILKAVGKLGPGEQVASLLDPGMRQRRFPESPGEWPSVLTNKTLLGELFGLVQVADASILLPTTIPYATMVGTQGVSVNLLKLSGLAAYAS